MSPAGRVGVLVVDDSPVFCRAISRLISVDPEFEVLGNAADGDQAAARVQELRPDVVTMDLHMSRADGYAGIARIMADTPTPILVLTESPTEAAAFRSLSLGALDILAKPAADTDLRAYGLVLRTRLKLLAGVKVIRHPRGLRGARRQPPRAGPIRRELVVIGASLGGPRALAQLLRALPADLPAPVAVVQHIADGFTEGLTAWLSQETPLAVSTARDGDALRPGRVLLAPSGSHLVVAEGCVRLSADPPVETFRPSATTLLASAARVYGARACGVILTGMGRDGAEGLKALRDAGGCTLAQDEASSAVFGMPRAAIELGAAERVLPLDEIPRAILEAVR